MVNRRNRIRSLVTRERIDAATELLGMACLVIAAALVTPALGFAAAGVALILWANVR
ncbi:MAG: hypothetical protein IRZ08_04460 [Frankia sp.]|nr:hypothetical protein [Frankia sp.]